MENEEKYRLLVENITDVIWTLDERGKVVFISPGIKKICGYTPEEVYATDNCLWHERVHPEDFEKVRYACGLLFKSGKAFDIE